MEWLYPYVPAFFLGAACGALALLWPLIRAKSTQRFLELSHAQAEKDRAEIGQYFTSLSQSVLNNTTDQFLKLAGERFKQWQIEEQSGHEKRQSVLQEMVKPVTRQLDVLQTSVAGLSGIGGKLAEDLQTLNKETGKLANALKNPVSRGNMGEALLARLLEASGLQLNVHYWVQDTQSSGQRPDIKIDLGGQLRIFIDAKAPLLEILDSVTPESETKLAENVSARVKDHIKALSKREYWRESDGPDFVVLFLPTDALYGMALRHNSDMLELAAEHKIILSSPMLLLALMRTLAFMQRQVDATRNAQDLLKLSGDLHNALRSVLEEFGRTGKHMDTATRAYNSSLKAFEQKVLPLTAKMEELQSTPQTDTLKLPENTKELPRLIQPADLKEAS